MLKVDAKEVARKQIPHTIPFLVTIDDTFDIGSDLRTPVDNKDYQVPFRFTGKISKLTFKLEEPKETAEGQKLLKQKIQAARNASQ